MIVLRIATATRDRNKRDFEMVVLQEEHFGCCNSGTCSGPTTFDFHQVKLDHQNSYHSIQEQVTFWLVDNHHDARRKSRGNPLQLDHLYGRYSALMGPDLFTQSGEDFRHAM